MKYRADIDGIRAIAVALVVLYHAHVPGFTGGFVGVDVFFVLSGFLITRILADDLALGRFSLARFFERRVRRLLPASTVMALAVAGMGCVLLVPSALARFGETLIATALYGSNLYFWREADYFAPAADEMPLLHTWSLGVEEQFYFVVPVAMLVSHRLTGGRHLRLLVPAALVSLAFSAWSVTAMPTSTFFLLPARAWELLAGSVLALGLVRPLGEGWGRETTALAGLAAILATGSWYTSDLPFPGPSALPPVLGTMAVLHAGSHGSTWVNRALTAAPLVWLGQRSYSFYLWHWPVFVLAHYWLIRPLSLPEAIGLIAVSLALAEASWRWVEQPFRHPAEGGRARAFAGAAAAMVVSCAVGGALIWTDGMPWRFPREREVANLVKLPDRCALSSGVRPEDWGGVGCWLSTGRERNVLLWGDSQAAQYNSGLMLSAEALEANLLTYSLTLCPPVLDLSVAGRPHCPLFNERALAHVETFDIDTVVLAARWELVLKRAGAAEKLEATLERLHALGVEVVMVGQTPVFPTDPSELDLRRRGGATADASFPTSVHLGVNAAMQERFPDVRFIDPGPSLCAGELCPYLDDGELLYSDRGHLSQLGSREAVRAYFPFVRRD